MFRVIRKDNYIIFSVPDCNKETNLSVFDLERTLTGSFQRYRWCQRVEFIYASCVGY